MNSKQRLSASVEAELIEAGEDAVARGEAPTLSAWVNDALRQKAVQDRRLRALAEFIAEYEEEHGEISAEEMQAAARSARTRAVTVRAQGTPRRSEKTRRKRASR